MQVNTRKSALPETRVWLSLALTVSLAYKATASWLYDSRRGGNFCIRTELCEQAKIHLFS